MGVDIGSILIKEETDMSSLKGKTIAFDAYNMIYQFITAMRLGNGDPLTDDRGNPTSHLSGLLSRTSSFVEAGIRPVYIFDGKPPEMKSETIGKRREIRNRALEKWELAKERGDIEEAQKYASASAHISPEIVEEAKELLRLMGIPYVESPSEGEAQAAYMTKTGDVDLASSQDYDSFLFGAENVIRNLTVSGRRKVGGRTVYLKPEIISLRRSLEAAGLTQEQLIDIGLCIGTDFNHGIPGIGPKRALEYIKAEKDIFSVLDMRKFDDEEEIGRIRKARQFFMDPPVTTEYSLDRKRPDREGLIIFLCGKKDFSQTRVLNAVEKLNRSFVPKQPTLDQWFRSRGRQGRPQKRRQKAGKKRQKAGKKRQKAGKKRQKAGKKRQKAGKKRQKAGKKRQKKKYRRNQKRRVIYD